MGGPSGRDARRGSENEDWHCALGSLSAIDVAVLVLSKLAFLDEEVRYRIHLCSTATLPVRLDRDMRHSLCARELSKHGSLFWKSMFYVFSRFLHRTLCLA